MNFDSCQFIDLPAYMQNITISLPKCDVHGVGNGSPIPLNI